MSDTDSESQLAASLHELEAELLGARRLLGRLQKGTQGASPVDSSMRSCIRCADCGCRRLIHANKVLDRGESFVRSAMALMQPRAWSFTGVGIFHAWVCTGCGAMEWYVATPLSQKLIDGQTRRLLRGEDPGPQETPGQLTGLPPGEDAALRLEHLERAEVSLRHTAKQLLDSQFNQRGVLDRSMRSRLCCPLCGGREVLFAAEVLDRADGPLRAVMTLEQPRLLSTRGRGQFEAWVCTACGWVEWYVPKLSEVEVKGKHRLLHGPGSGPAPPALPPSCRLSVATGPPSDDQLRRRTDALGHDLQSLRSHLARVVADLNALPPRLRRHLRCPACGTHEVIHSAEVLDRSEAGRSRMALAQPHLLGLAGVGAMEVWICTGCGLVEWAIPRISEVQPDGKKLVLVEWTGDSQGIPYR